VLAAIDYPDHVARLAKIDEQQLALGLRDLRMNFATKSPSNAAEEAA
jgi:hypothetical protein